MNKKFIVAVVIIVALFIGGFFVRNIQNKNTSAPIPVSDLQPTIPVISSTSDKPTCTLVTNKSEVQAGVEPLTITWTSKNATFVMADRPYDPSTYGQSQDADKLPPQGSAQMIEFDGYTATTTYYFYGSGGSTTCSVAVKIDPTSVIPSFPARLVKLEIGGTVTSADGKYSLTYIADNGVSGITVSVTTPSGSYEHVTIPDPNTGKRFGTGSYALNVSRCGTIGDGRDEFTFSLGDDPLPECVSRMG